MILFISSSNREGSAFTAVCDHRSWTSYWCATVREFRPLAEKIKPRAIVVRHHLLDGYSDDIFACLNEPAVQVRPRVIVLMSADRSAQTEARQVALGADCVLHDPVRIDILLEYLARYRSSTPAPAHASIEQETSFPFAGAEVYRHEHRIVRGKKDSRIAPQEVALLSILVSSPGKVVPYAVLYGDLFTRRFEGDTSNSRVLLGKLSASFKRLGIELRRFIQVIPKSGYLYSPGRPDPSPAKPAPQPRAHHRRGGHAKPASAS